MDSKDKYAQRGVSSGKEEVHKAIKNLDKGLFPDAFCKVMPDIFSEREDFVTLMHADGAGTKSSLAYVWWRLTGDLSVWKHIAQDAIVMNTDDLLCVGALGPMLFSSSIGRNKKNIPGEVLTALIEGSQEVLEMLTRLGLECHLSGGETADVGDLVRTVMVDSTVVCRMKKEDVIRTCGIREGMVVVGLCSYGKASYEMAYNSGMGSNGLTAARHDLFHKKIALDFPESFDPSLDNEMIYCGPYAADHPVTVDYSDENGNAIHENIPLAQLVLSPTRTYAPIMVPFIREYRKSIGAIIHCSGGGQTKILHFLQRPLRIIKDNLFEPGPLFSLLKKQYPQHSSEPFKNFNMGHRMEIYLPPKEADILISYSKKMNVDAKIIGRVEVSDCAELYIYDGETQHTFRR